MPSNRMVGPIAGQAPLAFNVTVLISRPPSISSRDIA
jgi:hypothetical protein